MCCTLVSEVSRLITLYSQVTSPIQFYIGARMLRPSPVGLPGSIRDVIIENVTATDMVNFGHGYPRNWTATLDGQPRDSEHGVPFTRVIGPNVTFENLRLTFRGGGQSIDVNSTCPHNRTHWMMVNEVRRRDVPPCCNHCVRCDQRQPTEGCTGLGETCIRLFCPQCCWG